jgi:glutathione S-transferase
MTDLILHHYPGSPFAEKVRRMLGYKKLAWKSVMIPVVMPKPDLVALTGGYRRTPVLQIGADIYCDTALIADVLERIAPEPSLVPAGLDGEARILAQWADGMLFWIAVPFAMQPAAIPHIFAGVPEEQVKAFAADRAAFRGHAPRLNLGDLKGHVLEAARRLEAMLADGRDYLQGPAPTIADFSLSHIFWFLFIAPPVAEVFAGFPRLAAWNARMASIGHGEVTRMKAAEAIALAAASQSVAQVDISGDCHGCRAGERVSVMPTDTGQDPVEGELVISTANEIAVRRTDERAGTVMVHFPRVGFQLRRLER